jgi:hypothetical protein
VAGGVLTGGREPRRDGGALPCRVLDGGSGSVRVNSGEDEELPGLADGAVCGTRRGSGDPGRDGAALAAGWAGSRAGPGEEAEPRSGEARSGEPRPWPAAGGTGQAAGVAGRDGGPAAAGDTVSSRRIFAAAACRAAGVASEVAGTSLPAAVRDGPAAAGACSRDRSPLRMERRPTLVSGAAAGGAAGPAAAAAAGTHSAGTGRGPGAGDGLAGGAVRPGPGRPGSIRPGSIRPGAAVAGAGPPGRGLTGSGRTEAGPAGDGLAGPGPAAAAVLAAASPGEPTGARGTAGAGGLSGAAGCC